MQPIRYIYECTNLNDIYTQVAGDLAASGYLPTKERKMGELQAKIQPVPFNQSFPN